MVWGNGGMEGGTGMVWGNGGMEGGTGWYGVREGWREGRDGMG